MLEQIGEISPQHFHPTRHIPLRKTAEVAIESAIKGKTKQSMLAADHSTEWYVLEVNIPSETVSTLFLENMLVQAPDRSGFRVFKPLKFADMGITWLTCTVGPVGYDKWAEFAVGKKRRWRQGECSACGRGGETGTMVFEGAREFNKEWWCSACWHGFFSEQDPARDS